MSGGCTKRPFATFAEARRQLRVWQRHGRRAELDRAHVYPADCVEHRGKFHVGRKHDPIHRLPPTRTTAQTRERLLDDLEDVFDRQQQRILAGVTRAERRRRARFIADDDGPAILAEYGVTEGDEFHVQIRGVARIRGDR